MDGSYGNLTTSSNGSYTIEIGKLEWAYLIETEIFLETFIIEED